MSRIWQLIYIETSLVAAIIVALAAINFLTSMGNGIANMPVAPLALAAALWLCGRCCVHLLADR